MSIKATNKNKDSRLIKLYVRLPQKIVDENQIKDLYPDIVKVFLPKQILSCWCTVELRTQEDLATAINKLRKIQIKGKSIYVSLPKKKKKFIDTFLNIVGRNKRRVQLIN